MFIEKNEYTNDDFKKFLRAYTFGKEIDSMSEDEQNTIELFVSILENLDSKVAKTLNGKLFIKEEAFNKLLNEKVMVSVDNDDIHISLRVIDERVISACETFNKSLQGIAESYNENKIISILEN